METLLRGYVSKASLFSRGTHALKKNLGLKKPKLFGETSDVAIERMGTWVPG